MITYTENQRRSLRYTGNNWQEEVLAASGVAVSEVNFSAISGAEAQAALDSIDNVLAGLTTSTASGIVMIDDVANVSGTTGDTLGNLDVITLPSGATNSVFRFAFGVPAQPTAPVSLRFACFPRTSGASGNLKLDLAYSIFDQGDDITPPSYSDSGTATQSFIAGDYELYKLVNIAIPSAKFSSGIAPFIVSCQVTRNASVSGNYSGDMSLGQLFADNVPGGIIGNQAGYIGGNLEVSGDIRVSGITYLKGGSAPATSGSVSEAGEIVVSDDFLYVSPVANSWKRIPMGQW